MLGRDNTSLEGHYAVYSDYAGQFQLKFESSGSRRAVRKRNVTDILGCVSSLTSSPLLRTPASIASHLMAVAVDSRVPRILVQLISLHFALRTAKCHDHLLGPAPINLIRLAIIG